MLDPALTWRVGHPTVTPAEPGGGRPAHRLPEGSRPRRIPPMRFSRALLAPVLILLFVVACSSPAATDGDDGNGTGDGSEQTQAAEETSEDGGDDGGGGETGGGGSAGDADEAFERLTPPNADEVTKTTASGVIFAAFTSPDSID